MRPGEIFDCPHCGRNTFLKKEAVLDGWTKKGDVLKCASCSAVIETAKEEPAAGGSGGNGGPEADAAERLRRLLGGGGTEKKPRLAADDGEKNFCRDCRFLVAHPFLTRCMRFGKDVNPMDDCPSFLPKEKT